MVGAAYAASASPQEREVLQAAEKISVEEIDKLFQGVEKVFDKMEKQKGEIGND